MFVRLSLGEWHAISPANRFRYWRPICSRKHRNWFGWICPRLVRIQLRTAARSFDRSAEKGNWWERERERGVGREKQKCCTVRKHLKQNAYDHVWTYGGRPSIHWRNRVCECSYQKTQTPRTNIISITFYTYESRWVVIFHCFRVTECLQNRIRLQKLLFKFTLNMRICCCGCCFGHQFMVLICVSFNRRAQHGNRGTSNAQLSEAMKREKIEKNKRLKNYVCFVGNKPNMVNVLDSFQRFGLKLLSFYWDGTIIR